MCEPIFDINFVEERNHILGLIFGVIYLFNTIEYHAENNLMRHDTSIIQKIPITLLNALNSRFQHMFRLTVHTNANS